MNVRRRTPVILLKTVMLVSLSLTVVLKKAHVQPSNVGNMMATNVSSNLIAQN